MSLFSLLTHVDKKKVGKQKRKEASILVCFSPASFDACVFVWFLTWGSWWHQVHLCLASPHRVVEGERSTRGIEGARSPGPRVGAPTGQQGAQPRRTERTGKSGLPGIWRISSCCRRVGVRAWGLVSRRPLVVLLGGWSPKAWRRLFLENILVSAKKNISSLPLVLTGNYGEEVPGIFERTEC